MYLSSCCFVPTKTHNNNFRSSYKYLTCLQKRVLASEKFARIFKARKKTQEKGEEDGSKESEEKRKAKEEKKCRRGNCQTTKNIGEKRHLK